MPRLNRREVLALGALLCAPLRPLLAGKRPTLLLSAASDGDDHHWLAGLRLADGEITDTFRRSLPARAHHIAVLPSRNLYVVVARRPDNWLQLGALDRGDLHEHIRVPTGRHVFGHGVFSPDGDYFYTSESDYEDQLGDSGLVVEWRVKGEGAGASLERQREFRSQGIGPHELLLHPDGSTLIVANGGIRTHPAYDRENLNIDTMQPSLVYLDRYSGALLEKHDMPAEFHQSGIRHLDVNDEGLVALAMQFEGEPFMEVPLLATHRRGEELRLLLAPPEIQPAMKQYIGALRFDVSGRFFAASCPKGNLLTFWDAQAGTLLQTTRARDGCGVCALDGGFAFSTGTGRMAHIDLAANSVSDYALPEPLQHLFWDNHMSVVSL